jgi:hypothetical protein
MQLHMAKSPGSLEAGNFADCAASTVVNPAIDNHSGSSADCLASTLQADRAGGFVLPHEPGPPDYLPLSRGFPYPASPKRRATSSQLMTLKKAAM